MQFAKRFLCQLFGAGISFMEVCMKNTILKFLSFLFIGGFFLLMPSISSYADSFSFDVPVYVNRGSYYSANAHFTLDVPYSEVVPFYIITGFGGSENAVSFFYNNNGFYDFVKLGTSSYYTTINEGPFIGQSSNISNVPFSSTNIYNVLSFPSVGFISYAYTNIVGKPFGSLNNGISPSYSYNSDLPDIKVSAILSKDHDYWIDSFDNLYCYLTINDNPTQPLNHYDFYKITIEGEKKSDVVQRNYLEFLYSFNLRDFSDSMVKVKVTPYKGTEYGNTIQLFVDLNNDMFTKYTGTPVKPNVTVPTPNGSDQVPVEATTNITYYYSSSTEFITSNFNEYVSYQQTVNVFNENNIDNSVENITNNNYEYFVTNNYYYTYNYDIDIDIDVSGNQLGIKDFINGFPSFGEGILNRLTELGFPKWLVVLVISCFGLVVGALVVKIIRSFLPF